MKMLWDIFKKGIIDENPIFVLALSLCPALAVTTSALDALTMGLSVLFVITANNTVVSLTRNLIHPVVRVPAYIIFIATIVTLVQLLLQAFAPQLYHSLGIYLALIVVFAIILARAEVFASKNSVLHSFFDGLGMGTGFLLAMLLVGIVRELFGTGSIFGYTILGSWYNAPLFVILPPGAFVLIGCFVGLMKYLRIRAEEKAAKRRVSL